MFQFFKKAAARKWVPVTWTFLTVVLLCLPGAALPGGGLFQIPHFDKYIHILLFGGIVWLWVLYCDSRLHDHLLPFSKIIVIVCLTVALGILLEFVQLNFIPNRSFDIGDIYANAGGSLLAAVFAAITPTWRRK
jgi:hypothetical protein